MGVIFIAGSVAMYQYRNDTFKEFMSATPASRRNYRLRKAIGFLFSFRSHKSWCRTFDKMVSSEPDTGAYHLPAAVYNWTNHPKDMLLPPRPIMFEGIEAYVPNKVEDYLKLIYGDYMQIPPPEKRAKHYVVEFCLDEKSGDKVK